MRAKTKWLLAAALIGTGAAACASTSIGIHFTAPVSPAPAPVVAYTAVPVQAARVFVPGHWEWQGNGHVWVPGRYMLHPQRYASRDRDRDGVPDRFDRAPFNPYRY